MLAIEMTANYIHIVLGSAGGKSTRIRGAFTIPAPWGSIRNGYIKSVKGISGDLTNSLLDHNLLNERQVAFAVDGTALKRKEVEVPVESRDIVLRIMHREMGELIADEDYIIDYIVKDVFSKNKKKYMNCILYAIPKVFLNAYRELTIESHLNLKGIDILNESIIKQIAKEDIGIIKEQKEEKKKKPQKKKKSFGKKELAEEKILEDDILEEIYNIEVKGKVKLWVGLYYEKIKIMTNGIDDSVFTKTIMLDGMDMELEGDLEDDSQLGMEKNMMIYYIKEIRQFLTFQKNVLPEYPIEEIQIYGEFSMLSKMCELTQAMVKLPTALLSVPKCVKGIESSEYAKYAGAIGCLLRR